MRSAEEACRWRIGVTLFLDIVGKVDKVDTLRFVDETGVNALFVVRKCDLYTLPNC